MTKTEVVQAVAMLASAFPSSRFTAENASAYETLLVDLEAGELMAAVTLLSRTSTFLPSIFEIRSAVLDARRGGRGRSPEDAWGDVLSEIRRVGAYGVPVFTDPIVAFTVGRLGWRNLCLEGRNDAADRARFCELYGQARDRDRRERLASPKLLGGSLPAPVRELVSGIGRKQ